MTMMIYTHRHKSLSREKAQKKFIKRVQVERLKDLLMHKNWGYEIYKNFKKIHKGK